MRCGLRLFVKSRIFLHGIRFGTKQRIAFDIVLIWSREESAINKNGKIRIVPSSCLLHSYNLFYHRQLSFSPNDRLTVTCESVTIEVINGKY